VEKYLSRPRHIEFQVFADQQGRTVHVFERECSIQRRHQKVVEESPSPFITPEMRRAMGEVAVKAAQAVKYCGAGTIEFLADADRNFYFLEMNTRIQVEHPITELVTGVDLVKTQIEVAAGAPLPFKQKDLSQRGWAVECRIYAEDPAAGFVPAPGRIDTLKWPSGPGVRNDAGVYAGAEVPIFYDPMISKLAVWGRDRAEAIARMRRALSETVIAGELTTNLDFHRWLMDHPVFLSGDYDTNFIGQQFHPRKAGAEKDGGPEAHDGEFTAAMLAVAAAAQHLGNGGTSAADQSRAPGRAGSAWKTLGRHDVLRR
jgi:acetyl/propionyl-CoA carboxylase alpha subunit